MSIIRRHFRRVEAPAGTGTLHDGHRRVATVTYALTVLQEIIGTHRWDGSNVERGARQVNGRLQVTSGTVPTADDHLTLRLADGRSLLLVATGGGPDYTIAAGSFDSLG